jgi:hypothetical protein
VIRREKQGDSGGGTVRRGSGSSGGDPVERANKTIRLSVGNSGGEGLVEVVSAQQAGTPGPNGVTIETEQLVIDLNALALVDLVSTALLLDHRETIMAGLRPDSGGGQKPIGPRARRRPNRISDRRGFATGLLADELTRKGIKGDATQASTFITGPSSRNAFLGKEAQRGIYYLSTGGRKADVIRRAVAAWLVTAMRGARRGDVGERKAGSV